MLIKTPFIARLQDCGDGSNSVHIYNNEDELIKDHPKSTPFRQDSNGNWANSPIELSKEERKEILDGYHDPYDNGYIERGEIELSIEMTSDGYTIKSVKLAKKIYFNAG